MFDEKEYRETFSQVKASQDLTRRVLNMKYEQKVIRFTRAVRLVFIGTLLISMLALTAFAYTGFCTMPPLFGLIANYVSISLLPAFLLVLLVLIVAMHEKLVRLKTNQ